MDAKNVAAPDPDRSAVFRVALPWPPVRFTGGHSISMMIPKLIQSALKVATGWVPGLGTFVEEALEHANARGERQSKLAKLLDLNDREWQPDSSPAALLRADFGVVPFHGRVAERGGFASWCQAEERVRLRLYTAPGGFGKTRLLRFLVTLWREHGWDGGFLREGALDDDGAAVLFGAVKKPLLLVLDYAESRRSEVEVVVRGARASKRKVRVVLLARSEGDWWEELRRAGDGVGDFFQGPAVDLPLPLAPLTDSPDLRRESFEMAVHAFATTLKKPIPEFSAPALDDDFERVLLIHAAALAAVEGEQIGAEGLLDWLLQRERRGIERVRKQRIGAGNEMQRGIEHAAALVTLAAGADSRADVLSIISRVPALSDQPHAMRERIAEALHVLYRGRRWCDGVEPDLVGEHLVSGCLNDAPELIEAAFGRDAPEEQVEAGLTLLNRLTQRQPEERNLLQRVIEHSPARLARPVVHVAIASGDPIGLVLADELTRTNDLDVARQLDGRIPHQTTALREVAAKSESVLLNDLNASGASTDEDMLSETARRANNLSQRLAGIGDRQGALAANLQAVGILSALTAAHPHVYQHDLAASLNNASVHFAELGLYEEGLNTALEAVGIRRRVAKEHLDADRPGLASSLNNLSNLFRLLGRTKEALSASNESVDLYRELAAVDPNQHLPDLALALNNLSFSLSELGSSRDAADAVLEAVGFYRSLTTSKPDAFQPALALSLHNLSIHLSNSGQYHDSLDAIREAVTSRRHLTVSRPDAFGADLASSLCILSMNLTAVGLREDARNTAQEAVGLYRDLAAAHPRAFQAQLAVTLVLLHEQFIGAGDLPAALGAIIEALDVLQPNFCRRPTAVADLMAMIVNAYERTAEAASVEPDRPRLQAIREILATVQQGA